MITKSYIKMCEEAKEIQKAWKPVDWDRFIYKDDRESGIACVDERHETAKSISYRLEHYIWLPTQEQLQEMMITKKIKWYKVFSEFFRYINEECYPSVKDFGNEDYSITYLWLCYIMKEKYNKKWDDNKWK